MPACWTEDKGSDLEPSLGFPSGSQELPIEIEKCFLLKVSQSMPQGFQSGSLALTELVALEKKSLSFSF